MFLGVCDQMLRPQCTCSVCGDPVLSFKGTCGVCGEPVFLHHTRTKDTAGQYVHGSCAPAAGLAPPPPPSAVSPVAPMQTGKPAQYFASLDTLADAPPAGTNSHPKHTLGLRFNPSGGRVLLGAIPGSYADVGLKLMAGDAVVSVEGVDVTDQTVLPTLKMTQDVVGAQVKIEVERKGGGGVERMVLIRQTADRVAQCDKICKALGNLGARVGMDPAFQSLSKDVLALIVSISHDDAAIAERLCSVIESMQVQAAQASEASEEVVRGKTAEAEAARSELLETKAEVDRLQKAAVAKDRELTALLASKAELDQLQKAAVSRDSEVNALRAEVESLKSTCAAAVQDKDSIEKIGRENTKILTDELDALKAELSRVNRETRDDTTMVSQTPAGVGSAQEPQAQAPLSAAAGTTVAETVKPASSAEPTPTSLTGDKPSPVDGSGHVEADVQDTIIAQKKKKKSKK